MKKQNHNRSGLVAQKRTAPGIGEYVVYVVGGRADRKAGKRRRKGGQ